METQANRTVVMRYQGEKKLEIWLENDVLHRVAAPARIQFKNDKITNEAYFKNGVRHREDGPAIIEYFEDGNIASCEYWLDGHLIKNLEKGVAQ
jgi:antitoxin component YwqK of YwqJK toxin-antitoxin module